MPNRTASAPDQARRAPAGFFLAAALTLLLTAPPSQANDRPFQEARTAIAEDDDNTWSVESWATRLGTMHALSVEPEYSFDPHHSVQMEFTRTLDRAGAGTGQAVEVEYKYLLNRFDRDGYGVGLSVAIGAERQHAEGANVRTLNLKLPLSFKVGGSGMNLHLNPGWAKSSDARGSGVLAMGLDYMADKRSMVFAEAASQRGEQFAQFGLRWWMTKEKLALDIAAVRTRVGGERATGLILGIGAYDL